MSVQRLYDTLDADSTLAALLGSGGTIEQADQLDGTVTFPERCIRFWGASYVNRLGKVVYDQSFVVAVLSKTGMLNCEAIMKRVVYILEHYTREGGLLNIVADGAVGPYWDSELKVWRSDIRTTFVTTT